MKNMPDFCKYHALGNDYIVIDPAKIAFKPSAKNVRLLCDRNIGIGSDGILLGPFFFGKLIKLRIFNPDGKEAEKSGNGVRIFAKFLRERGYVRQDNFSISTKGGEVAVSVLKNNIIKARIGKAEFDSKKISLNIDGKKYNPICLSLGNPHCVIFTDDISKKTTLALGPQIENHKFFPQKTNVSF
ncbi:MAG: diaminopimelate epimerase, partial [Elusimicrobia bacterium]|nr:diaminopimelate epimerase [Elusimicrobiota bacterium]